MTTAIEARPDASPQPPSPAPRRNGRPEVRRSFLISGLAVAVAVVLVAVVLARSGGSGRLAARLSVLNKLVEVRSESNFAVVNASRVVHEGDEVRTDEAGQAELVYPDGSLTRLDSATQFRLLRLAEKSGKRAYRLGLKVGRTWNRVTKLTSSEGRFEVETSNAVAAVRGTTFMVECRIENVCTITVFDGHVLVTARDGRSHLVGSSQSVTVTGASDLGDVKLISISDLAANDAFVADNLRRDGVAPSTSTASTSPTPTTTTPGIAAPNAPTETTSRVLAAPARRRSAPVSTNAAGPTSPSTAPAVNAPTTTTSTTTTVATGTGPSVQRSVLYSAVRDGQPAADLYRRDPNGTISRISDFAAFTGGSGGAGFGESAWDPAGADVAVIERTATADCIVTMFSNGSSLNSGAQTRVCQPNASGGLRELTWSPDGRYIAYGVAIPSGTGSSYHLALLDLQGSGSGDIPGSGALTDPDWSPDGARLVAAHDRGDGFIDGLSLINPDGSGLQALPASPEGGGRPDWSRDGRYIAYDAGNSSGGIAIIAADGSPGPLPGPPAYDNALSERDPCWDGGGSAIVFANTRPAQPDPGGILAGNADGSGTTTEIAQDGGNSPSCA